MNAKKSLGDKRIINEKSICKIITLYKEYLGFLIKYPKKEKDFFCLMTNDDITLESYNIRSGHVSSETFKVDANYDGNFDDNDAYDYNYFVLSSGYSFSCANEFVNYCKKHNLAKIIGQKSGGGAFSISPAVTPFGSFFFYGSLNGFRDKNGNLTEDGIDVDYELSYDDFYSSQALITAIKSFE